LPQHLKRSVYNAGLAKALMRRRSAIGELAKDKKGGRAKAEEGKASPAKETPKTAKASKPGPKAPTKAAAKIKVPKKIRQIAKPGKHDDVQGGEAEVKVDLDSAFNSNPTKSSNLAKDAGAVSKGVKETGNTVATITDAGGFARGTKGVGGGGGGQSVGIGALKGTGEGGGRGAGDYGILPSKGHEIRVPETEELVILGGLDRDVIAAIIRRYLPQIQHCYEQQLVTNSKLKGKVTVSFMISGSGSVQSADVQESTLRNAATERCMLSKIMGWKFPKPRGGGTVGVKYPFILMSTSGGDDD
jgi:outer membrane biosynthesis protein TonB